MKKIKYLIIPLMIILLSCGGQKEEEMVIGYLKEFYSNHNGEEFVLGARKRDEFKSHLTRNLRDKLNHIYCELDCGYGANNDKEGLAIGEFVAEEYCADAGPYKIKSIESIGSNNYVVEVKNYDGTSYVLISAFVRDGMVMLDDVRTGKSKSELLAPKPIPKPISKEEGNGSSSMGTRSYDVSNRLPFASAQAVLIYLQEYSFINPRDKNKISFSDNCLCINGQKISGPLEVTNINGNIASLSSYFYDDYGSLRSINISVTNMTYSGGNYYPGKVLYSGVEFRENGWEY